MIDIRNAPYAALILRVGLGVMLLAHGLLKIFVFTIPGTVGFFEKVGFPGALAYYVIVAEVICGLLLIAGLYSRWAALAALPVLLGAVTVHAGNGWQFTAPNGGWEFPAFWAVALLAQSLMGNGAYALEDGIKSALRNAPVTPRLVAAE
jgi:putative oxidoreductase